MKAKDLLTNPILKLEQKTVNKKTCNERGPASHALCTSSKPSSKLGASQLNSCKAQGLRPRSGKISYVIDGDRVKMRGKKIKGKNYGGPLPKWSEDQEMSEDPEEDDRAKTASYYTVGDVHAIGLSHSAKWSGHASKGALSNSSGIIPAIDSIPKGSVVCISLGQNDSRQENPNPKEIASNVQVAVEHAKQKGLLPIFLLFPELGDASAHSVRDAIKQTIQCPIFDLEGGVFSDDKISLTTDSYEKLASLILSRYRPRSAKNHAAGQPSAVSSMPASQAKQVADQYLGRVLSSTEWDELVRVTAAEASNNTREQAFVMGAVLNRVRSGTWGGTVQSVLRAKNQFHAVTGAGGSGASSTFVNGPSASRYNSIISSASLLPSVPKNIVNFTAASDKAYTKGTSTKWRSTLLARNGVQIGGTIFSA